MSEELDKKILKELLDLTRFDVTIDEEGRIISKKDSMVKPKEGENSEKEELTSDSSDTESNTEESDTPTIEEPEIEILNTEKNNISEKIDPDRFKLKPDTRYMLLNKELMDNGYQLSSLLIIEKHRKDTLQGEGFVYKVLNGNFAGIRNKGFYLKTPEEWELELDKVNMLDLETLINIKKVYKPYTEEELQEVRDRLDKKEEPVKPRKDNYHFYEIGNTKDI